MLSPDVRFEGFTQSDWARVLGLFRPRAVGRGERDPDRPQGGVIAVHGSGRLRKLLHTQAGRLRLDDVAAEWPLTPEALARRHHASWAIVLEQGALENVMERFGARLRRGDDLTAQAILFATLVRDELATGAIAYHPSRLAGLPMPTSKMVSRSLDAVCPREHSIVLGLFDAGELHSAVALRRGAQGGFDWIVGPDELRRDMGLLAGDFRRDYRHLARAVERRIGRLSLGVFSELSTFRALEVDPTPGAWARAVAIRDVVLSPVPAALAVPLGLDAGRAALSAVRGLVDRAQGLGAAAPVVHLVRDALTQASALAGLAGLAGLDGDDGERGSFDPLELVRRLLSR